MNKINPLIESGWNDKLMKEFKSDYFFSLKAFLKDEKRKHVIYPPGNKIFEAFNLASFNEVKVVILGQDPYHGKGQAHGLCFSVPKGVPVPPSLGNIYKEISNDMDLPVPLHGNLESWAKQGVLLLNATLTVRAHKPGSHQNKGWETFTDAAMSALSEHHIGLVFLLWGNYAKSKERLIDSKKHLILKAAHPSPFSAYNGFFGCKHFSKANEYLKALGKKEIYWGVE